MNPRFLITYAVLVSGLCGCADTTPSRLDVKEGSLRLTGKMPVPLGVVLLNKAGQTLLEPSLTYSATPSSVLSTTPDGKVSCLKSGEGTVLIAGGGQSASVTVLCRLVVSVKGPTDTRLILGRTPDAVAFEALDESGVAVPDVSLYVSSSDPKVVRIDRNALVAVSTGEAKVTAKAGDATMSFSVSVVELITSQPLVLNDGASVTFTLQQGHYELDINAKAEIEANKDGVTVSWVGTDCPAAKEAREHHLRCTVAQTASLTVRNPTSFGLGPALNGFINLYRTSR